MLKRLGSLFIIIALGLGIYNTLQLSQVRAELAKVQKKTASPAFSANSQSSDLQKLLAQAEEHGTRAKVLMQKGKIQEAKAEMQKSIEKLRAAEKLTGSQFSGLKQTLDSAQQKMQDLIKHFESEKPGKSSSTESDGKQPTN